MTYSVHLCANTASKLINGFSSAFLKRIITIQQTHFICFLVFSSSNNMQIDDHSTAITNWQNCYLYLICLFFIDYLSCNQFTLLLICLFCCFCFYFYFFFYFILLMLFLLLLLLPLLLLLLLLELWLLMMLLLKLKSDHGGFHFTM